MSSADSHDRDARGVGGVCSRSRRTLLRRSRCCHRAERVVADRSRSSRRSRAATPRRCVRCWQAKADVNSAGGRRHDRAALGGASATIDDWSTLLLAAGAKAPGREPLRRHAAVICAGTNGNAAMIERLLAAGADPNAALPDGETRADDGGAHRQRRGGQGAARARRRRQRARSVARGRRR